MNKEFNLKIECVTKFEDRCDSVVYERESLLALCEICGIPKDDLEGFDPNLAGELFWDLDVEVQRLLKQWATLKALADGKKDIFVISEIKGSFILRGVTIKVDYTGVQKDCLDNPQAQEILKRREEECDRAIGKLIEIISYLRLH